MMPLNPEAYASVLPALLAVPTNTFYARAVVERRGRGAVFVDRADAPGAVWIAHAYGMSLLFGSAGAPPPSDAAIQTMARRPRAGTEWLQVYPDAWASRIDAAGASIARFTRLNFAFNAARYRAMRARFEQRHEVTRVDRPMFDALEGSVVPRLFWDDAGAFEGAGAGWAVLVDGAPASVAFSAFVSGDHVELGIETAAPHRGRGLAIEACVAAIDDCLARGKTPVWACRLENVASHRLAERLGFEVTRRLPYFALPPTPARGG